MTPLIDTPTILIIDDTPSNLGVVVDLFEARGYRVAIAQDGEEGLQRADLVQPDLILLDVMMPGIDGFETCRRLKALESTRDIPVIFMTTLAATEHKVNGFDVGAVDYVTKPLQIDEIMARVDTHLKLHAAQKRLEEQNAQLDRHREELELRVAERTVELNVSNLQLRAEIEERISAQEKLAAREREFRTLAENAPDQISRHDRQCRYFYINPQHEKTLGISMEDIAGRTPAECFPGSQDVAAYQAILMKVIETGQPGEYAATLPDEGSGLRYHNIRLVTERDANDQVTGVLAIGRDVTALKRAEQQLAMLGAAIAQVHEAAYFVDDQARIFYVNEESSRQLGYSREEFLGMTVMDIAPGWTAEMVVSAWQGLGEGGASTFEAEHQRKDGSIIPVEINVSHLKHDGKAFGLAMARDITGRKRAERELHLLNRALDNSFDAAYLVDIDLRFRYVNEATVRELGYSREDLLSMNLTDIDPNVTREAVRALMRQTAANGRFPGTVESYHRRKNGETFPVEVGATTFSYEGETLFLTVVRDITERREAERLLHEREQAIRAAVENSPDTVIRYDSQCRRIYLNPAMEKIFGLQQVQLLDTSPVDSSPLPEEYVVKIGNVLATGQEQRMETPFRDAEGQSRWVDLRLAPEFGSDGKVVSVLAIGRDISERKVAEDALRESEEKYRTLIQKIQAAVVVHGADTRILTSNVVARQILGLSEDQLQGKTAINPAWHFFREDGSPMPLDKYPVNLVLASRQSLRDLVLGVHRPNGENDVWVLVNADPVFGKNGELVQVIVTFVDITQRKNTEEALANREREFRTLAENSPDIIMRYDTDCQRTYVNSAYVRETHVPMTDALNVTPRAQWQASITPPVEEYLGVLHKVMTSGEPADLTVSWRRTRDGSIVFHALRIVAERDAGGRVVGTLAIGRNITAQKLVEQELKESAQRYRGIFDNVLDTLYLLEVTPEGRFRNLEVNPAFEKSSGMSSAELIGKFIEETVPQEVAEIVIAKYRRCVEAGTAIDEEVSLDMPGGLRHYHSTLVPVRDASGRIHRIVGISRDVTERKQAEELLHAREQEFRAMVENSPDIIARYDTQCRRIYVNPAMQAQFGLPIEKILGRTPLEIAALQEVQAYVQRIQSVLKTGQEEHMEFSYHDPQGAAHWGDMRLVPEFGTDGAVSSVLAVTRDITGRKEAEHRLHASEQMFRAIVENTPDLIVRMDRECRRIYINPAIDSMGIDAASLLGKKPLESVLVDSADALASATKVQETVMRVLQTGEPAEAELSWTMPDGQPIHLDVQYAPELDPQGQVAGVVSIARDITERKRMELHMEESRLLLRQLASRNETAREDERKYLKRELHDELGQYLLALRLGISVVDLEFGVTNAPLQERTQRLIKMVDSTIKVVRNVVASLRPAALDLGIVSALEWLAGEYSERTGIQLELHVSEEDIDLDDTCATAIFRIVQESLTNTVRHAQASKVEITLERNEAHYLLEVRDNGRGFDPALRKEKSFGLVSIRERALMLGGKVEISSAPGRGTVIRVHIPIYNVVTNALSES